MIGHHKTQMFLGLPATGKSTFLAALWHVIESNRDGLGCSLALEELDDDCQYVNSLSKEWRECEDVARTRPENEQTARVVVREKSSGRRVALRFPDLSGETFRDQWEKRFWTPEYVELLSAVSGLLLFVHPKAIRRGSRLVECDDPDGESLPDVVERGRTPNGASEGAVKWSPKYTPTAVQLVELLQFATRKLRGPAPCPVAVIVSAWDLARVDGVPPEQWFADRLPLLSQYLRANPELFVSRVFGISALGDDLTISGKAAELAAMVRPSERIIVVAPGEDANDITAPIRWILNQTAVHDD